MMLLRILTILVFSASAISIFVYQGIEFAHAMIDFQKNK